jgi:phenylacetate-CoA ligase
MGIVQRIIKKQPNFIKKIYYNIVPFKKRYGSVYGETVDFLNDVDNWTYDRTKEFQFNELKRVLIDAQKYVPYYGKLFSEYEFNPNISSFNDIRKLPYLTKDIINDNFEEMVSTNFNGKKYLFKTSGSTGKRLQFYGEDSMYKKEAAYISHSFKSHGSDLYNDWSIWIRRHSPKDNNDLMVKDYELKRIYLSAFHLNDQTIYDYVKIINNSKIKTIVTYPSTAYWLSCLLEKNNLILDRITSLHGASEKCLPIWSDKIKSVFGFDFKMHYGQVEKVSFAYQSSVSNYYHESLTYSFTEYDENNTIIGTSFMNNVMPFIRYKTNDVVELMETPSFDYSSPLIIKEIDGRVDDMIVSDTNSKIPSVNFYTVMSKIKEVRMFQFRQKTDKSTTLSIVVEDGFNDEILNELKKQIQQRVGNIPLFVEVVNEIHRDPITGKIRCVITDIK